MNDIKPCQVQLLDLVRSFRQSLREAINLRFQKKLSAESGRLAENIAKANSFRRSMELKEDLALSSDSDCQVVEDKKAEFAVPNPVKKTTKLKKKVAPSWGPTSSNTAGVKKDKSVKDLAKSSVCAVGGSASAEKTDQAPTVSRSAETGVSKPLKKKTLAVGTKHPKNLPEQIKVSKPSSSSSTANPVSSVMAMPSFKKRPNPAASAAQVTSNPYDSGLKLTLKRDAANGSISSAEKKAVEAMPGALVDEAVSVLKAPFQLPNFVSPLEPKSIVSPTNASKNIASSPGSAAVVMQPVILMPSAPQVGPMSPPVEPSLQPASGPPKKHKVPKSPGSSHLVKKSRKTSTDDPADGNEVGEEAWLTETDPAKLIEKIKAKKDIISNLKMKKAKETERANELEKQLRETLEKLKASDNLPGNERIKSLEEQLLKARSDFVKLAAENRKGNIQMKVVDSECQCDDEMVTMQDASARHEIDQLRGSITKLSEEIIEKTEKNREISNEKEIVQQNLIDAKRTISKLRFEHETSQSENVKLHRTIVELNKTISDFKLDAREEMMKTCADQDPKIARIKELERKVSMMRRELIEQSEHIQDLHAAMPANLRESVIELEDGLAEAECRNDQLQRELEIYKNENRELISMNENLTSQFKNVQDQLLEVVINRDLPLQRQTIFYKTQIETLRAENEELLKQVQILNKNNPSKPDSAQSSGI